MFVGTMGWPPNEEGVRWFAKEIWPLIRERLGSAKLYLVGRDAPSEVKGSREQGIHVEGFKQSLAPYLHEGNVFVVPILTGSGVRIKALEAIGAGMPVVTTTVGVEGLTLENGIHILRRDEPAEFASAVVELLSDRVRMSKLGSAARSWVESNYTWRSATDALEGVYRELTLPPCGGRIRV